ncbi:hypothetical protein A0H81_12713 [Grifola frondosa]|uniref:CCHC-type domain-containing protein n=1 Tax=Grifola frondosa TaxID=5627 RepID=A0A1C7LRR4_GRIFR|nr:hypothetical protein A0H81_12713 [Grifola frondosa]
MNATSSILGMTLTTDDLMLTLTEKYKHHTLKSKGAKESSDAAFSAGDKSLKGESKQNVKCFNCKKKGHYKSDCWAPEGGKEGQGPKGKAKAKEAAAMVKTDEKSEDAVWLAMVEENVHCCLNEMFEEPPANPLSMTTMRSLTSCPCLMLQMTRTVPGVSQMNRRTFPMKNIPCSKVR